MSLIDQNELRQEPTDEEKLQMVSANIKRFTANTYQELVERQKRGIQIVWNNPQGFTPQQVLDTLGTDAAKVFEYHAALTKMIVDIATSEGVEPDIDLPTNAFTINSDGTITVKNTAYSA